MIKNILHIKITIKYQVLINFPKKGHDIITFPLYHEPFGVSDGCRICKGNKVMLTQVQALGYQDLNKSSANTRQRERKIQDECQKQILENWVTG